MQRRDFIALICAVPAIAQKRLPLKIQEKESCIMTVSGLVQVSKLGTCLPHEHFITDFSGAKSDSPAQYKQQEAINLLLPLLEAAKAQGINTIFECSPSYIGKNVRLLEKLSKLSCLNLITNTGYYAAVKQKYLPDHAYTESAMQLSQRWISDYTNGIEGSGIKPGFIKLGTDNAPLKEIEIKLIKAAGITHLKTGLQIAIHTGNAAAAVQQLKILEETDVKPSAFIWVHAQNDQDEETQLKLASRGCWISLDGLNSTEDSLNRYLKDVLRFKAAGLLHRLLISHDDGFSAVNKEGQTNFEAYQNGNSKPYITLFTKLKPLMLQNGITTKEFELLTQRNPANAYMLSK